MEWTEETVKSLSRTGILLNSLLMENCGPSCPEKERKWTDRNARPSTTSLLAPRRVTISKVRQDKNYQTFILLVGFIDWSPNSSERGPIEIHTGMVSGGTDYSCETGKTKRFCFLLIFLQVFFLATIRTLSQNCSSTSQFLKMATSPRWSTT